jgi:hypothetical protein
MSAVLAIVAVVCAVFVCDYTGFCQTNAQEASEANVVECDLWYKPSGFDLRLHAEATSLREKKGPDFGENKVNRGAIQSFPSNEEPMLFVWDRTQGKLYIDLNNNLDLTDDANGVFSSSELSKYQFNNMQVERRFGNVPVPYVINAQMFPSSSYYFFRMKSGFEGKIQLAGRDLRVLLADNLDGVIGRGDFFAITSADSNFNPPCEPTDNDAPQEVFMDGRGWAVSFEFAIVEDRPCVRVKFKEISKPMGEVRIDGSFIRYMTLKDDRTMIVLERPQEKVTMPVGTYILRQVYMDAGVEGMVQRSNFGTDTIRVEEDRVETLKAGGPLSNTVEVKRVGRILQFNYKLVGADGKSYVTRIRDDKKTPKFAVYKADRQIGSGTFSFG